eukprot:6621776-Pyramimonas_sp.AAC.1
MRDYGCGVARLPGGIGYTRHFDDSSDMTSNVAAPTTRAVTQQTSSRWGSLRAWGLLVLTLSSLGKACSRRVVPYMAVRGRMGWKQLMPVDGGPD